MSLQPGNEKRGLRIEDYEVKELNKARIEE